MIRAYDDNGNVVDLVQRENEIYNNALYDVLLMFIREYDKTISFKELLSIIITLQKGKEI